MGTSPTSRSACVSTRTNKRRVIDLALRGAIVGNASTEIGSTTVGEFTWQTRLTRVGDGFRLNGTKYFTTGTLYADYAEVLASDPDGATVIALVPTDRDGVTVLDDWDGMGQRVTASGGVDLVDVEVLADEVLPRSHDNLVGRHTARSRLSAATTASAGRTRPSAA